MKEEKTSLILRFLTFFKPYRALIFIGFILLIINLGLNLVQPVISKFLLDDAILKKNLSMLHILGGIFLVSAILSYLISSLRQYIFLYIQQRVILQIRKRLSEHILNLPLSFHNYQNPGYLMSRVDADVGNLSGVMTDTYIQVILDILMLLASAVILFILSWKLALLVILLMPFFLLSLKYFSKKVNEISHKQQETHALSASSLYEIFSSIFPIRLFNQEGKELQKFIKRLSIFTRVNMKMIRLNILSNLAMGSIATLAPLSVIWYGGYQVITGTLSIGSLFAFNMYLVYLFNPMRNIFGAIQSLSVSLASLERIYQIFDIKPLRTDIPIVNKTSDFIIDVNLKGLIELQHVTFAYRENHPVINDISLKIEANQNIAFVGQSGAGKSTVFNLLLRLYDNYSGKILLDGIDIQSLNPKKVREVLRLIPQEPYFFNRSIFDNIAYGGKNICKEEIINAARIARAEDFILRLPQKYDTIIGERGITLSGGEKQRIALARALVSNPRILLLDEATSFLDSVTESEVYQAIRDASKSRTCITIAHRLKTVIEADRIYVLNNGRIEDSGKHHELYETCTLYRDLCDKQLTKIT